MRRNKNRAIIKKKNFFVNNIRMTNLSLNELKLIARSRRIKGYESMSKTKLLSVLNESESAESEKNFENARIK